MRPWLLGSSQVSCIFFLISYVNSCKAHPFEVQRSSDYDNMVEERTFFFGKLVLVPVLAALGLKFLALLPIVLTKIALLSAMNFLSSNLNLLVSTLFGLKNFMNKFGLWAQEDNKRHPELEAFAELANQPFPIFQPSYKYQFSGFEPTASGLYRAKFDRRTKTADKRHVLKPKKIASATSDSQGKYKCYWTNKDSEIGIQSNNEKPTEFLDGSKLSSPNIDLNGYSLDRQIHTASKSVSQKINEPLQGLGLASNLPDYRSLVNEVPSQQVATHGSAEKIDDKVGIRDGYGHSLLPFTRSTK